MLDEIRFLFRQGNVLGEEIRTLVPDWVFVINEVSNNAYVAIGKNKSGRGVRAVGYVEPENVLLKCVQAAQKMDRRKKNFWSLISDLWSRIWTRQSN